MPDITHDIFISYVEEDEDTAVQLAKGMEIAGYSSWYYIRDSVPGPYYFSQVNQNIDAARMVMVIISPKTLESNQVLNEITYAHENRKSFIPILKNLSHAQFQQKAPSWRLLLGASTSIRLPEKDINTIFPKITKGVAALITQNDQIPCEASYCDDNSKVKTKKQENIYEKLSVNFSPDIQEGIAPLTVHFTDETTGNPFLWRWNFGDGCFSTEKNPIHTYQTEGDFIVELIAYNEYGPETLRRSDCITVYQGAGIPGSEVGKIPSPKLIFPDEIADISILIVDDEADICEAFQFLFKKVGYKEALFTESADKAVLLCVTERPDVVQMDLGLAGSFIDGVQTAYIVTNILNIPVIFFTGRTIHEIKKYIGKVRHFGLFQKPMRLMNEEFHLSIFAASAWYKCSQTRFNASEKILSREKLAGIVNSELAMAILDHSGQIIFLNKSAENLLGLNNEAAFFRNFLRVITIQDFSGQDHEFDRLIGGKRTNSYLMRSPNGTKNSIELTIDAVENFAGEETGYLVTLKKMY